MADGADPVLEFVYGPVVLGGYSVGFEPALFLGGGFSGGAFGSVVGDASGAGVGGFASGGDSFGDAVDTGFASVRPVLAPVGAAGVITLRCR